MVITAGLGLWLFGIAGATLLALAMIVIAAWTSTSSVVRRGLDRADANRARRRRESARSEELQRADVSRREQYAEVRSLVERAEGSDAALAERLELETLLDEFVRIAVRHQRCLDAVRPATVPPGEVTARRRELVARRIAYRDACERHAERLGQELDELEEVARLIDQKLACPADDCECEARIEHRLGALDEVETAMAQLPV
jgi:hypothetical protein